MKTKMLSLAMVVVLMLTVNVSAFAATATPKNSGIHVQQTVSSQPSREADESGLYQPEYLPGGFAKAETVKFGATHRTIYKNKENISIKFDQAPITKAGKTEVDTVHTTYQEITINGQKALLFAANTPTDTSFLFWQSDKTSFKLSSTISQQELIKIAENMKIKNN